MENPAWLFFSFWAVIGITFLHLGFISLDKRHVSESVSPVVMSFFKHFLAVSSYFSSSYALIFRPLSRDAIHLRTFYSIYTMAVTAGCGFLVKMATHTFPFKLFELYFSMFIIANLFSIFNAQDGSLTPELKARICIHIAMESTLLNVSDKNTKFFPMLLLLISFYVPALLASRFGFEPMAAKAKRFFTIIEEHLGWWAQFLSRISSN